MDSAGLSLQNTVLLCECSEELLESQKTRINRIGCQVKELSSSVRNLKI